MRILTWNGCHGICTERFARLEHLKSDVTIMPEAHEANTRSPGVKWAKVYNRRGIAVSVNNGFSITRLGANKPLHPCIHAYHISGPISFNLLACWSHPLDSKDQDYRSPWVDGITAHEAHLKDQPLVIAGDFNDNPYWDKDYQKPFSFELRLGGFCKEYNLVSAYHKFYRQNHGKETRFTHFNNRKSEWYHIDYILVPQAWRLTDVTIGSRIFDHRPLLVTVAD
jgi:hypothetical protein